VDLQRDCTEIELPRELRGNGVVQVGVDVGGAADAVRVVARDDDDVLDRLDAGDAWAVLREQDRAIHSLPVEEAHEALGNRRPVSVVELGRIAADTPRHHPALPAHLQGRQARQVHVGIDEWLAAQHQRSRSL
jgi:hypothetical protein